MKKYFIACILMLLTALSSQAQRDFIVNNPTLSDKPGMFPGGTETITFDFFLSGGFSFDFSSDDLSNDYGTMIISFGKLDASGIQPTGTGAALFNWVYTSGTNSWVGTTKDVTMNPSPPDLKYKITFSNVPITEAADKSVPNLGYHVTWTDPGNAPVLDATNNDTERFTYTVVPISGNVWNDKDGNAANNSEANIISGVWANLVNPLTNAVVQSVQVDGSGNYTLGGDPNTNYKVILTNSLQSKGASLTTSSLPVNYVNTGVNLGGTASTTNQTGKITINTGTVGLANQNFGIEQLPESDNKNVYVPVGLGIGTTRVLDGRPYGTNSYSFPPLSGSDPEDGTLGSGKSVKITTLPNNATLTYNGNPVIQGDVITGYDPSLLSFTVTGGGSSIVFKYAFQDAAGKVDATPADYTITFPYVLPVSLTFTAQGDNGDAKLDWITSSEQNNAGFAVEHSLDGLIWNQLGFVNSKALNGNSAKEIGYQYIDRGISNGSHYYRLKQTDLNGAFAYSNVGRVDNSLLSAALKVYPNPTSSYVYIEYNGALKTPLRIIDVNGRIVKTLLTTSAKTKVETKELAPGTYIVSIDGKTSKFTVIR